MRDNMQFSLSGSLASMANGLPYSIGAAGAFLDRQIVCIGGDGFTILIGEIATLVIQAVVDPRRAPRCRGESARSRRSSLPRR
jgi:pyruvate dehydrogenase (quinone)